ncbi:MAG: acetyl-CoA carboxylase biotin carboxylase subunit [Candidatus Caldatribacteriaceae bacterium]
MFRKMLIANRGEIALRILRACGELGIKTVGIFSDADSNLLHLRYVDQKVSLGGNLPTETYLNVEKILRVCELTGVDAVHPGYGFLSENADFVEKLINRGFTFIGPNLETLRGMKDKLWVKKRLYEVNVPVVPGPLEPLRNVEEGKAIARELGYPILLKACLGGGGRGIRVVERPDDFEEAFQSATREAKLAFGREELYMERLIKRARHVEVQILADHFGNVIHLGERECSLQRRRQKILEEAPAPGIDEYVRLSLRETGVRAAKALGYTSCGTLEFLLTEEGNFYFMEFNARIQVEHPVTEVISGIDIVREQIRISAGEPLQVSQEEVFLRGHALEMRINAEDPARKFIPSPGKISRFEVPHGPGIRLDTHCYPGYVVPPYYDSLLGKLIVWDSDREFAIRRARSALRSFTIEGVQTTIPFHLKILAHPEFGRGVCHTQFLEDNFYPE